MLIARDSRAGTDFANACTLGTRLGLIGQPIALFDVANCEAFVQRALTKSGIAFAPDEREVLLAEGLTILHELAKGYKPLPEPPCGYPAWFAMALRDRAAHERDLRDSSELPRGTFDGHAAMRLPQRLGDAWHKMHPEHRYVTDPETGQRGWRYGRPPVSLDQITSSSEEGGERDLRFALRLGDFVAAA